MGRTLLLGGRVRQELGLDGLDAIHFPLSVMLPLVSSPPAATTILDLQHEFLPENFPRWELAYRRRLYGASARRSRIVIAISEHARETLVERLSLEPERVRTIHLGVDLERFSPADVPREPFLVYPANAWPHKNHERLFEAVALLRREHRDLRLVLDRATKTTSPTSWTFAVGFRRTSSSSSTAVRPRSSSPACTKASASPCSRRSRARVRWRAPTCRRFARSPATSPSTSIPSTPSRLQRQRSRRSGATGPSAQNERRLSPGTPARASTTRSTASCAGA